MRWTTGRELTIYNSVLYWKGSKTPNSAHLNVSSSFASSATTLNIETTTVPRAMIVTVLTVLCLPARTMGRCPLCCQISLSDRQKSGQPQHGAAAAQYPRNLLSRLRQHGRFNPTVPTGALRRSTEHLKRLGHPKDVTDLLL
jgi:hypothetical protein